MDDLAVGFGFGFFLALQIGPMSLFLIRSTLRSGVRVGLSIGVGIAAVDAAYAALGAVGAAGLLTFDPLRLVLSLAGAAVLVVLGVRTFLAAFRIRSGKLAILPRNAWILLATKPGQTTEIRSQKDPNDGPGGWAQ